MNSFGLLRTNVGLTTNIKIVISKDYKLSLDSIESDMNLSYDRFKNVSFNKSNYYDDLIPYFYKNTPADTAFSIKYDNDSDNMSNDFANQYDELYQYGARNIVDNKNYSEEYEYFAPIYITKNGFPSNFVVFRVDGPGIADINKSNFNTEILSKFKTVKLFDLTRESVFGEWIYMNFINNSYFPDAPLEFDFRSLEFCRWNGIDYETGGYASKSLFVDDIIDEEKEIFEFDKFIFNSYRKNKVVFPNILNLNFLFDDSPSTPDFIRKWSINRYYGFYLDSLERVEKVSPYLPPVLKDDILIRTDNFISSTTEPEDTSYYPFLEPWTDKKPFYIEYNGIYYNVEQVEETLTNQLTKVSTSKSAVKMISTNQANIKSSEETYTDVTILKYKIIGDIDLSGKTFSDFNTSYCNIVDNKLVNYNDNPLLINGFNTVLNSKNADIWLIEIDGVYHNLVKESGLLVDSALLFSDYSFSFSSNSFTYKVGGVSKTVSTIVDFNNKPVQFSIYKAKFTDIKDFDDRIVDTEYSKYEYELASDITNTDETKMYFDDLSSTSNPIDLDDFVYKNEVVNIPVSSEYTANYETFKVESNELSDIWRKNPVYSRFAYQNSLSANDVPYPLNNSIIFEDYNRTTNISDIEPKRYERNLDYFYTINSASASYIHQTLHIERLNSNNELDSSFKFELDRYLSTQYDYFTYLFGKGSYFYDGKIKKNTNKFSYFNIGDETIPNHTLFRGIKFNIYNVTSINLNSNNQIDKINTSTNNTFADYKLSILLSDNDTSVVNTSATRSSLTQSSNNLQWIIIDEWKMSKVYPAGSYVIFDDILYKTAVSIGPSSPISTDGYTSNPYNQGWAFADNIVDNNTGFTASIFFNPLGNDKSKLPFIYNNGDYYLNNAIVDSVNFWCPNLKYASGIEVLYKNNTYISIIDNNKFNTNQESWVNVTAVKDIDRTKTYMKNDIILHDYPQSKSYYISLIDNNTADITDSTSWKYLSDKKATNWTLIQLWSSTKKYTTEYVVHNDTVFRCIYTAANGEEPGKSNNWNREYSIKPDTDIPYNIQNNAIIEMNDKYYLCKTPVPVAGARLSTLDNNIIIYIHKRWKNILININIADNTYDNISGSNRDDMYNELYKKLTGANFTKAINDISNKYGFSDYISYVIINEDGSYRKYNYDNIIGLPYILNCEGPDTLEVKVQSLTKSPVTLPNVLNPVNKLADGVIKDISQLNYYNNNPVAANITENNFTPKVFENYHGSKNILTNSINRFSGYYMPLFYEIELFKRDTDINPGNYIFDTTLTSFGIAKERKIRKINRKGSILKLKNDENYKSIYPMLDEFGYSVYDFFIFSSTWDLKYYLEFDQHNNDNKDYLKKLNK